MQRAYKDTQLLCFSVQVPALIKHKNTKKGQHAVLACWPFWSGLLDSNQRPLRPERSALPTALNPDALKASAKVKHFFETRAFFSKKMLKNLYD